MKRWLLFWGSLVLTEIAYAQNFELIDKQDSYQATFSQLVKIPLKIKNNTDKSQFYVIRKVRSDLGETQKGYFCLENNCLEPSIVEFSKRVEPGETINLYYTVESGLVPDQNTLKFEIYPKGSISDGVEHNVNLSVEEKSQRSIYQSRDITIHDVYPNPVQDIAIIDYKINSESIKAKIVMHNVLGRPLGDYELPYEDTRIKIQMDDLPSGVYFYTLYINNGGVLTRKIMVRK
ncbi:MAG TPA: T9SS type A sorting domain-containing protein [Cyclobacteriaceae bacterium]|nr:T9SS type A sorting domain-containing protein [Cyclobacteriaceae bacterium]